MLDQMSGGRLRARRRPRHLAARSRAVQFRSRAIGAASMPRRSRCILKGLTQPTLDHKGEFYHFRTCRSRLAPLQKPHPPMWFGGHSLDGAARAAQAGRELRDARHRRGDARLTPTATAPPGARAHGAASRCRRSACCASSSSPRPTRRRETLARRAYPIWHSAYDHLHRKHGLVHERGEKTAEFRRDLRNGVRGVCGTPAKVARELREQAETRRINYLVGQFSFGDLSERSCRSIAFRREVMPALRRAA